MSTQTINQMIPWVLFLHGIAHVGPLIVNLTHDRWADTGGWKAAHSRFLPSLSPKTATLVACTFWVLSLLGFVAAALSFWGVLVPEGAWRQLAVVSAIISSLGILLFIGTWPVFNTLAAMAVNVAVLLTQLWLHSPLN